MRRMLGILGVGLLCLVYTHSASAAVVHSFEFNTASDLEGFSGLNVTGLTADGDSLNGTASGNDPQLSIGGAGLE